MRTARSIIVSDFDKFTRTSLRRFRNSDYALEKIATRHGLSSKQISNGKKQAEQLGYCLALAHEYWAAAESVTLATKPVLLYYSIMNFALAEVLMKQDGRSSLDQARARHAHHGLEIAFNVSHLRSQNVAEIATALLARPHMKSGHRSGTFELWHQTAREYPVMGKVEDEVENTHSFSPILFGSESNLTSIKKSGISFFDVLKLLPTMQGEIGQFGIVSNYTRTKIFKKISKEGTHKLTLIMHPSSDKKVEEIMEAIRFSPRAIQEVKCHERAGGFILEVDLPKTRNGFSLDFPMIASLSESDSRMCTSDSPLNEFGAFYLALYILGNLSRYYPEIWMEHVNSFSTLALISEAVCEEFSKRIPLLVLGELEGCLTLPRTKT